jgi:uncharacterized membrane protein YbhN (UPF0104 family)
MQRWLERSVTPRTLRIAAALLATAVFALALWVLQRELGGGRVQEVLRLAADFSPRRILLAIALTAVSFLVLTGYDNLSLRYIRRPLPYRQTALASFLNYAFSQGLGFPLLTGGSVRLRLYSRWGLSGLEVAQVVAFASVTFWFGVVALTGLVLLWAPPGITRMMPVTAAVVRPAGVLLLAVVAAYFYWTATGRRVTRLLGWRFRRPAPRLAALQLGLACVDWTVAGLACWVLMPADIGIGFPSFVAVFLLAFVAGILSHVPAGLGVFESAILLLLPASASEVSVLASLLVYRGVYYLLPLVSATLLLGGHELWHRLRGEPPATAHDDPGGS